MNTNKFISYRFATALIFSAIVVSGCSSDSDSSTSTTPVAVIGASGVGNTGTENTGTDATDVTINATPGTTRVTFDITVPVYVSNQLQVRLVWGDKDIVANWVMDESWSISENFPTNIEKPLSVTFTDGNGAVTLASFETNFRAGSSVSQAYSITEDQFNTDRWDSDNDGVSNLAESIAGTAPLSVGPPQAVEATLEVATNKTLRMSWLLSAGSQFYRVLENVDGASGFTQISSDLESNIQTFDHEVALYNVVNAQYIVQACNESGCVDSDQLIVSGTLDNAITYIKASNTGKEDEFGVAVSLSADGTTLAVGANGEASGSRGVNQDQELNDTIKAGAVYIFSRVNTINGTSGQWEQQAYIKASNSDQADHFGEAISLSADGNTLAVGARSESSASSGINMNALDNTKFHSGAVYVFERSNNTMDTTNGNWAQSNYIKASNPSQSAEFGGSVSLSADGLKLAVGAFHDNSGGTGIDGDQDDVSAPLSGAVYVFVRLSTLNDIDTTDGINTENIDWYQQAYIKASNTDGSDRFGGVVSLSADGNTLAVGTSFEASGATGINDNESDNSVPRSGAVYVFSQLGDEIWQQQAYVKSSNSGPHQFGTAVSLSADGNTLVVGAPYEDSSASGINGDQSLNNLLFSGAAYVYIRTNGSWTQQAYLKARKTGQDFFGGSVSLSASGDVLAIGASSEKSSATGVNGDSFNNSSDVSGAAYLFSRSNGSWQQKAYVKASNTDVLSRFGAAVSLSADGETLAVGANTENGAATGVNGDQFDSTIERSGAVYLY